MIPDTVFPSIRQHFEEPDILVVNVTTEGELDLESILGIANQGAEIFEARRDIYWLNKFGKAKGVSPAARRELKAIKILRPYAYVGVIDSFAMRALIQVLLHGLVLVGRIEGKIALFKNEAEARAWIAEDRVKRNSATPR